MPEPLRADSALRRLAAHGLPGCSDEPVTADSTDHLQLVAERQRVLPQLYRAVRSGMVTNASDRWVAQLRDRTMSAAETTLAAHAAAMEVTRRLHGIGIDDVVVLKGCATAHLDYERAVDRFSSDVDLLVPGDAIDDVVAEFDALDEVVTRGRRWHRRYGHSTTLHGLNDVELDMHVRVAQGYVGLSTPPEDLRLETVPFSIGDIRMRGLDGPNRLIHAAVHTRSVHIGLHSRRDVPQLVLVSGVDWEEAVDRAERWQIGHFLALGVLTAWRSFELPDHPLTVWAERHRPTSRRETAAARIATDRLRGSVLVGPLALPTREWPGYVWPLLFPSRAYVAANRKGWRARLQIVRSEFRSR